MASSAPDLQAPVLLLAMPQVLDPFFQHSVVLLLHHNDEGSLGFIVNRPTEIQLADILSGMEISWHGPADDLAFFGGPVQSHMGTVMFSTSEPDFAEQESTTEVCPGILITQQLEDLGRLAENPPASCRLFLGYAGWGAGQLVDEIMRNDWLMAPVQTELLFSTEPEESWKKALESVGVDPDVLPAWTQDGTQEDAN